MTDSLRHWKHTIALGVSLSLTGAVFLTGEPIWSSSTYEACPLMRQLLGSV